MVHIPRGSDSECPRKVVSKSRKHGIYTHFPKDRNCEVCKRTKITRALRRRRTGEAVPRAENFGDLTTADHKVLNEGGQSRNNDRYAVVVQDLATQWTPSYPCKTKTSQETERSFRKFLEPSHRPKVENTDNTMEFGRAREDLSCRRKGRNSFTLTIHQNLANLVKTCPGIIVHQHPINPRQMVLLKELYAE